MIINESRELADRIVQLASDRKASNIVLLDIRQATLLADYFVICTGETSRQIRGIVSGIVEDLSKDDIDPLHVEGQPETGWMLVDYGNVVVHVMGPKEREYYSLERVWSSAVPILVIQ
jgi:ribosome-associated protein